MNNYDQIYLFEIVNYSFEKSVFKFMDVIKNNQDFILNVRKNHTIIKNYF
jgi:hypothetical protein